MTSGGPSGVQTSVTTPSAASNAAQRWSRWLARGAARDERLGERTRYVTIVVGAGLLGWLAFALAALGRRELRGRLVNPREFPQLPVTGPRSTSLRTGVSPSAGRTWSVRSSWHRGGRVSVPL